jgi:hypothetical protein
MFKTLDGGKTWTGVVSSAGPEIKFANTTVGWSFWDTWDRAFGPSQLSYTTDGGNRWLSRKFAFPANVRGFSLPQPDRGYVVGDHGMVYRYRVVPFDYSARGMIDAPMMGGGEPAARSPFKTTISARIRYDDIGRFEYPIIGGGYEQGTFMIIGGGDTRFTLSLATKIEYKTNMTKFDAPVRAHDLIKADVCPTDIQVAELNLKNDPNGMDFMRLQCRPVNLGLLKIVPNWLNNGWFKDQLNNLLSNQACFDITTITRPYLRNGASL